MKKRTDKDTQLGVQDVTGEGVREQDGNDCR